jgi:homoserine O-succinyltransferase
MPDGAFLDTEEQFRRVLAPPGSADCGELVLYSLPGLTRSASVAATIDARYRPLEALWSDPPDALIVTGTEPGQRSLKHEPYWPGLARLLGWAADAVPAVMLSCLAAHASVLLFDGIERVALADKRHGVFAARPPDRGDALARHLPDRPCMPHSRINDVATETMLAAGYTIVAADGQASWSLATRSTAAGAFVLCQGHPEYSPSSLLREYRRDVRRALLDPVANAYPQIPAGYLDAESVAVLTAFEVMAKGPGADGSSQLDAFPFDRVAERIDHSWAETATALYTGWLAPLDDPALPSCRRRPG